MQLELQLQNSGFSLEAFFADDSIEIDFSDSGSMQFEFPLSGLRGINGKSAYEVAIANGFVGTEAEWLTSLASGTPDWNQIINKPPMAVKYDFSNTNMIVFQHNMQKYPSVYIEDTGGNQWNPERVDYTDTNNILIVFSVPFSGTMYLS